MKKLTGLVLAGVAVFALSGCGGSSGYYDDDYYPPDNLTTLFLIDQNSDSYAYIPYRCYDQYEVLTHSGSTSSNGEFSFYPYETCDFDFLGLYGNYENDPYVDDIVYIVDDLYYGKGGIEYDCVSFGVGTTYRDGSFDYDINDQCAFYL